MKRFIDLRGQVLLDDEDPKGEQKCYFAWFDTITDTFEDFDGCQLFTSWADFEDSYSTSDRDIKMLKRYRSLTPDWVPHHD